MYYLFDQCFNKKCSFYSWLNLFLIILIQFENNFHLLKYDYWKLVNKYLPEQWNLWQSLTEPCQLLMAKCHQQVYWDQSRQAQTPILIGQQVNPNHIWSGKILLVSSCKKIIINYQIGIVKLSCNQAYFIFLNDIVLHWFVTKNDGVPVMVDAGPEVAAIYPNL